MVQQMVQPDQREGPVARNIERQTSKRAQRIAAPREQRVETRLHAGRAQLGAKTTRVR